MNNTMYVDDAKLNNCECINTNGSILYMDQKERSLYFDLKALDDFKILLKSLPKGKWKMPLVPDECQALLEDLGFYEYAIYEDYVCRDLNQEEKSEHVMVCHQEDIASLIKIADDAQDDSRGFTSLDKEFLEEWMKDGIIFKYVHQGQMMAYVLCSIYGDPKTLWIRQLCTHSDYRHRGIASTLMKHAFAYGIDNGAVKSFLACDQKNTNAIRLYEKFAYKKVEGERELVMAKVVE